MAAAAHIAEVMVAVRARIKTLEGQFAAPGLDVEIGNPAGFSAPSGNSAKHLITLFLYRIEPDHAAYLSSPERGMAVKLRVMINVYGVKSTGSGESAATTELRILSEIMRLFMEEPVFGPIKVKDTPPIGAMLPFVTQGIEVEAQQLSLDMEEINHIWTTQGETPFRTALVYSFNYGVVAPKSPKDDGPPVLRTEMARLTGPGGPDDTGVYPDLPDAELDSDDLMMGALAFRSVVDTNVELSANLTLEPAVGLVEVPLLLVTEQGGDFAVTIEILNPASGTWQFVPAPVVGNPPQPDGRQITAVPRAGLGGGGASAGWHIGLDRRARRGRSVPIVRSKHRRA